MYGNLERLSAYERDREFQMFWANIEVIKPSIYAKPPTPVVTAKFKDRRPVYQQAAELMERCCVVAFDLANIDDIMLQIRDDVSIAGRGVAWCRYESGKKNNGNGGKGYSSQYDHEKVCIDFKHRRDFLHSVSRCWYEVTWVAAASYLTRDEARKRFKQYSGDAYQEAEYKVDKDSKEVGGADARERAKFWEIWHKPSRRVLWVAQGCEDILDEDDPHLDLCGFFPCPKPAYGCTQRGSLVPVPDVMQYKDQLEELNLAHLPHSCAERGGRGQGVLSGRRRRARQCHRDGDKDQHAGSWCMVPIKNWASFGQGGDPIIWLPIDMIAQTITGLVALRKQIIEDIYQIMGLSDIMRGATDPQETLGAQQLKTQYGSSRIRDKQQEMVRIARDLVEIVGEIIVEKFDKVTMIEMSQTQLPTEQMQRAQAMQIQQQMQNQQMAMEKMQMQAHAGSEDPAAGRAEAGDGAASRFKRSSRCCSRARTQSSGFWRSRTSTRCFISSSPTASARSCSTSRPTSTIQIDENAEKQRRTEFVQVLGGLIPQLSAMIAAEPKTAKFAGDILKFATAPFRAGRQLEGSIDELVEQMEGKADQPRPDDPTTAAMKAQKEIEQIKQDRQRERDKADVALKAQELQMRDAQEKAKIASNEKIKMAEITGRSQDDDARANLTNMKAMNDREKHQATLLEKQAQMGLIAQKAQLASQTAQQRSSDMAQRGQERRAAQQFKQTQGGGWIPT